MTHGKKNRVNNEKKYQLLKNTQASIMKIAEQLSQVRSVSSRDEALINLNQGRLEGLAQGLDFFIESFNETQVPENKPAVGFALSPQLELDLGEED